MPASRRLIWTLILPVAALIAVQAVPYGRDHSVPADGAKPAWSSPRAVELAKRACFDCHSNETRWPWYSNIAPVSWRIFHHVSEGREHLNFSAFDPANEKVADAAGEAGESVTKQSMPPADYLLAHPEARLTAAERRVLATELDLTFSPFAEGKGQRGTVDQVVGERGEPQESEREARAQGQRPAAQADDQ